MTIINLTPHTLNIHLGEGDVLEVLPSGDVCRISTKVEKVSDLPLPDGRKVPVMGTAFGNVKGLPAPKVGVTYVVSGLVRSRLIGREDVMAPGPLVRNEKGQPVGCQGLTR